MGLYSDRPAPEKLILNKASGEIYEVDGVVEGNFISIDDMSIPVEINDYYERKLPNGISEYYSIIDTKYIKKTYRTSECYLTEVQRMTAPMDSKQKTELLTHSLRDSVFISHRSEDQDVADMLKDFLVATGVPNSKVFCSSLPGNDVVLQIRDEVKKWLKKSIVNILILSKSYYESAYCLNEAGIAWYLEDEVNSIAVCLPEIDGSKMSGFFNKENKIRRLDKETDVAAIYDIIQQKLNLPVEKHSTVTRERQKLAKRYKEYIASRASMTEDNYESEDHINDYIEGSTNPFEFPPIHVYACVMLYFAAKNIGSIIVTASMSDICYIAGKDQLNSSNEPRELAKWEGAIDELLHAGYIKRIAVNDRIYQLTSKGYSVSDSFEEANNLDSNMTVDDVIRELRQYE